MIDTVVLTLDVSKIGIPRSSYDLFTPSARGLFEPPYYSSGKQKIIKCVLNPSTDDKKKGVYLPRITLFKAIRAGGYSLFMHIEFSAPKILFNNNFDELSDDDFSELCRTLAKRLLQMGFFVFSSIIETADVKAIHYSKNVIIDNYSTASSIIAKLSKSNISTRKNADVRAYGNGGDTIHFFTTRNGVAIYDKLAELNKAKKSEKGRIEKDSYCQLSLFDYHQPRKPFEVLRIEARYNDRKSIKNILAKTENTVSNLTFRDLFSSRIAKSVLQYEMQIINDGLSGIPENKQSILDFTNDIFALNPTAPFSDKMKAVAMKALFVETGSRDIRKFIRASPSQWSRLIKSISKLRYEKSQIAGVEIINEALNKFNSIKLHNYKEAEIDK